LEIKQNNTGHLTATLSVTVTPADYQERVETVIKDYARRATIKGFRPGKVPANVVRKMFGKGVVFEELNKILGEGINQYLKDNNVRLVGEPLPVTKDIDLEGDSYQNYEFDYEIGLAPEVRINYGLAGNAPFYKIEIDDALLDKEIDDMRSRYGDMTNPETSEAGDILYGKLSFGEFEKMLAINPTRVHTDSIKAQLAKSHKAGDILEIKAADVFENDHAIRRFWETGVSGDATRELNSDQFEALKNATYQFEVRKINRMGKIEVGPKLYEKAFGEDHGITDESEFRKRVADDMAGFFGREAVRFYRSKVIRALVEGNELPLPDDFLKAFLLRTRENMTDADLEEVYPSYSRSLRWRLIVEKMQQDDSNVNVSAEDLKSHARQMVLTQYGNLVDPNDTERLDSFAEYFLKDEKYVEQLFNDLLENRVFEHLGQKNPPVEESITASDFIEKLKAEN
jgi:trigger factor